MPERKKWRVVIDPNWWVNATINAHSRRTIYYQLMKRPDVEICYSPLLLDEYDRGIVRRKFSKYISPEQVRRFKSFVLRRLNLVEDLPVPPLIRDPKDDYLIGVCRSCEANVLLTGDPDLLELGTDGPTVILTMRQFLTLIGAS